MWVEMLVYVSGGRGDGTDWPQPGQGDRSKMLTGEVEGRDLIKGKLAVACDPPPWAYETPAAPAPPEPPAPPAPAPPAPWPQVIGEVAPGRESAGSGGTEPAGAGTETSAPGADTKPAAAKTTGGAPRPSRAKTPAKT